jgi:hypothetical protein
MDNIRSVLEPIAAWFNQLNLPEPITHWGHPVMMGIVVFVMGSFVGVAGWRGRVLAATDTEAAFKSKAAHRQLAPWLFLFITLGYTGGVLSLVMQGQPIFESSHFWTGSAVIGLLAINGGLALLGFQPEKVVMRTIHAYVGTIALALLVIHALLGLKLGISI